MARPRSELGGAFPQPEWSPTAAQLQDAFFTLAHEFGHYLSWRADEEAWKLVHVANVRRQHLMNLGASFDGLSLEDRERILAEEERAWSLGREHVPEELRHPYDAYAQEKLDGYRNALPLGH